MPWNINLLDAQGLIKVPGAPPQPPSADPPELFEDYGGFAFAGEAGALAVNDDWANTIYDYVPRYAPWPLDQVPSMPIYTGAGDEAIVNNRAELVAVMNNASIKKIFCAKGSNLTDGGDNDQVTITASGSDGDPRYFIYYDASDPQSVQNIRPWNQATNDRVQFPRAYMDGSYNWFVGLSFGLLGSQMQRMGFCNTPAHHNMWYRCNAENANLHSWGAYGDDNTVYQCVSHDHSKPAGGDVHGFVVLGGERNRFISIQGWECEGDFFQIEEPSGANGNIVEDCDYYKENFFDSDGTPNPNGEYAVGEGFLDFKNLNPDLVSIQRAYGNRCWAMRKRLGGGGSGAPCMFSNANEHEKHRLDLRWNVFWDSSDRGVVMSGWTNGVSSDSGNTSVVRNILHDIRGGTNNPVIYSAFDRAEFYLNTITDCLHPNTAVWQSYRPDPVNVADCDIMGNFFQDTGDVWNESNWGSTFKWGYNAHAGTYTVANKTYPIGYEHLGSKASLNMGNFTFRVKKMTIENPTHANGGLVTIVGIVPTTNTPIGFRQAVPTSGADQIGSRSGIGVDDTYESVSAPIFNGDFETGNFMQWHDPGNPDNHGFFWAPHYGCPVEANLGPGQSYSHEYSSYLGTGELLEIVTSPTRQVGGSYAAKFAVKRVAEDVDAFNGGLGDWINQSIGYSRRTNIGNSYTTSFDYDALPYQTTRWLTSSIYVPSDYALGGSDSVSLISAKAVNFDWGGSDGLGPLGIRFGRSGSISYPAAPEYGWFISLHTCPNQYVNPTPIGNPSYLWQWGLPFFSNYPNDTDGSAGWPDGLVHYPNAAVSQAALANINYGGWTDWAVHMNLDARTLAQGGTGFVDIYKREDAGPWIHVLQFRPANTTRGGINFDHGVGFNNPPDGGSGNGKNGGTRLQIGQYHPDWANTLAVAVNPTLYYDCTHVYDGSLTLEQATAHMDPNK